MFIPYNMIHLLLYYIDQYSWLLSIIFSLVIYYEFIVKTDGYNAFKVFN